MTSCAPKPATKRSSETTSTRHHIPGGMYKANDAFPARFDLGRPAGGLLTVAACAWVPAVGRFARGGEPGPGERRSARRELELLLRRGRRRPWAVPQVRDVRRGDQLHLRLVRRNGARR